MFTYLFDYPQEIIHNTGPLNYLGVIGLPGNAYTNHGSEHEMEEEEEESSNSGHVLRIPSCPRRAA